MNVKLLWRWCLCTFCHQHPIAVSPWFCAIFCKVLEELYSLHPAELSAFYVCLGVSHLTLKIKRKCVEEIPSRNMQHVASPPLLCLVHSVSELSNKGTHTSVLLCLKKRLIKSLQKEPVGYVSVLHCNCSVVSLVCYSFYEDYRLFKSEGFSPAVTNHDNCL